MRVGVHDLAARQQRARPRSAPRTPGRRLVDVHAGEQRHPGIERAVVADRLRHVQPVRAAKDEIVLAMAGRDMDEAGAGVGGDEIASSSGVSCS